MITEEDRTKFILGEIYSKVCNCRRNYPELDNLLNTAFHLEDCPYRILVEKHDIEWKPIEQTPE